MKNSILFFLFLFGVSCFAQEITSTLAGNTSAQGFSVINAQGNTVFRITGEGNVGIGIMSPTEKLVVNGNALINGLSLGTTAFGTTILGKDALISCQSMHNTAIGFQALMNTTDGFYNIAVGSAALINNTTGNANTAIGEATLYDVNSGSCNIGIGYGAGTNGLSTLNNSVFVGTYAYTNVDGLSNTAGIGFDTHPTASNQVRLGNSSITSIGGYADWTNFSDGRYKMSIQENVKGLDFIMKLRPITYKLDVTKLATDLGEGMRKDKNGKTISETLELDLTSRKEKSEIVYTGFIGQEVEKAAKELGYDFSGIDAPKNKDDFYGLRYAEFVVPLVKAMQEQQKQIENLNTRIETLEKEIVANAVKVNSIDK